MQWQSEEKGDARRTLLDVYRAALNAVDGRRCVARSLGRAEGLTEDISVIAIGKAAAAMLLGARDALGARARRALVVTKHGHALALDETVEIIEAGHPSPDRSSLYAGTRLLAFLAETPPDHGLLFLISGGTSALVEVLPEGVGLADLTAVNEWLLGSGLDIATVNRVRKAVSCIKGGRLLPHLGDRPTLNLMISDVPQNDPAVIGSGLLVAEPQPGNLQAELPSWLEALIGHAPPAPGQAYRARIRHRIVADNRRALEAGAAAARARGLSVHLHEGPLTGDAAECGRELAGSLRDGPAGLHVWGGETTLRLPAEVGRGGRNQHLGLAAAEVLAGTSRIWLLAGATDGSDGPTQDAGALVDGGTVGRGQTEGLDVGASLRRADAGRFLEASGDLLQTGPTGTNVMDVVLGLKSD